MLRLFTGLADEAAKLLSRLFGNSNVAKTEITELKNELQTLIDKVGKSEEKAQKAFEPLEKLARQIEAKSISDDVTTAGSTIDRFPNFASGLKSPVDDLLEDLSSRTTASTTQVREALVNRANEAYLPDDPKRMRLDDDESLQAYIETRKLMGEEDELIEAIANEIDMPPPSPGMQKIIQQQMSEMKRPKTIEEQLDDALKSNKQEQIDQKALEDKMADIKNFDKMTQPGGLAKLKQEVQDEKIVDLEKFRKAKDPIDDDFAMGGRVGAKMGLFTGIAEQAAKMFGDKGLMKILFDKVAGMSRADRVADVDQAKNIIRDPDTDLRRIKTDNPTLGTKATPEGKMTIADVEDLPEELKYKNPELRAFEKVIKREKVRAILADQLGVDPKDIPEENIDMAIKQGIDLMATGGRVGLKNGGIANFFKKRNK